MTAYLKNAPAGVPGDVTRLQNSIVEPILLGEEFTAFGVPYKLDASTGKAMMIDSGDAATVFKGILSRSVPSIGGNFNQGLNDAIPNDESSQGGLVEGYINVLCPVGTPVKGGIVYMRVTAAGAEVLGSLETGADGGDCVALTGVEWASNGKDANNIAEIKIK
jgi:hypothetical protein